MPMQDLDARRAKRILFAQLIAALIAALAGLVYSPAAGASALLGGMTAAAGNAVFAMRVFGRYRAQNPGRLLAGFYGAELMKLVFVACAFAAIVLLLENIEPIALFGSFLIVQILPIVLVNYIAR